MCAIVQFSASTSSFAKYLDRPLGFFLVRNNKFFVTGKNTLQLQIAYVQEVNILVPIET